MGHHTIIIAEVGECWNGDVDQAKQLIESAAQAGCDYVKFQTLDRETVKDDDPERDWFLKVALNEDHIRIFIDHARKNNIKPLFTPANLQKIKMLKEKFHQTEVKIASSVSFDQDVIDYAAGHFQKIFVSSGMNSEKDVKHLIKALHKPKNELYIFHCVSEYPTGPLLDKEGLKALSEENVQLKNMAWLKKAFPRHHIGYSDHTVGTLASVCAVAAGAEMIEKHITLDREKPIRLYNTKTGYLGTDHVLSLEPKELVEFVSQIRKVEKIMGQEGWYRSEGENLLKNFLVGRF
ncbi:MAG: N-acetylneuraminate synthase family protein [Candidatus Omnitrophica bacterium]|nr:N-acetylneuraminate synthase family protein [Candidatus Omnitrophota bacterium]